VSYFGRDEALLGWVRHYKTMVLLGVDGEADLERWEAKLGCRGIEFRTFREPDMEGAKTALATLPCRDGRTFRGLRLL
jgi:hypothetical protein